MRERLRNFPNFESTVLPDNSDSPGAIEPDKTKPVWLSGATGFIGRHLQRTLASSGRQVRAYVRPDSSNTEHLLEGTQICHGDLVESAALQRSLQGVGAVIYLAGAVRGRHRADFHKVNVQGVQAVCEALVRIENPPPLLLMSSLAASQPQLSDYANSKAQGEGAVFDAALTDWTLFRPPAVYGPGDAEMRPIFDLMRKGIILRPGSANQRIALLNVADLCAAVMAWLEYPQRCFGATFALDDGFEGATGRPYLWQDMARAAGHSGARELALPKGVLLALGQLNVMAARVFGYLPMLSPGKSRELQHERWVCDNTQFTELTGWHPKLSLELGLQQLYDGGLGQ